MKLLKSIWSSIEDFFTVEPSYCDIHGHDMVDTGRRYYTGDPSYSMGYDMDNTPVYECSRCGASSKKGR
jgi:hypothetical protein